MYQPPSQPYPSYQAPLQPSPSYQLPAPPVPNYPSVMPYYNAVRYDSSTSTQNQNNLEMMPSFQKEYIPDVSLEKVDLEPPTTEVSTITRPTFPPIKVKKMYHSKYSLPASYGAYSKTQPDVELREQNKLETEDPHNDSNPDVNLRESESWKTTSSLPLIEPKADGWNNDLNESGYDSSPLPSSTTSEANQSENQKSNLNDIDEFTKDVDSFYKSSTSNPFSQTLEYGMARDTRESLGMDDFNNTLKSDIEREEMKKNSGGVAAKKCNNLDLKSLMETKMTGSASISKQMIYSAASEMYAGQSVNVICSKHSFSYVVVTSPSFCEHKKKVLTCLVFLHS